MVLRSTFQKTEICLIVGPTVVQSFCCEPLQVMLVGQVQIAAIPVCNPVAHCCQIPLFSNGGDMQISDGELFFRMERVKVPPTGQIIKGHRKIRAFQQKTNCREKLRVGGIEMNVSLWQKKRDEKGKPHKMGIVTFGDEQVKSPAFTLAFGCDFHKIITEAFDPAPGVDHEARSRC